MNQRAIDRVIARIRAVEEYGSSIPPYSRDAEEFARELVDMLDAEPEPAQQYSQREVLVIQTAAQFSVGDSTDDFNLCIASARRMLDAFDASREAQS